VTEKDKLRDISSCAAHDLFEMQLIGNRLFRVAVRVDADPEFKTYILAAGSAHSLGMRSIDNVLRKHGDKWLQKFQEGRSDPEEQAAQFRNAVLNKVLMRCKEISELDLSGVTTEGTIATANIQIRLESTFRAALQLIWLGFAFESEAVIRLGLEQIAWSYAIRNLWTKEDVDSTSATGWMTKLKEVFPGAGRIYNRLSNLAHVAPSTHTRFLGRAEAETFVKIRSPAAARESMLLLSIVVDAFLVVSEMCFSRHGLRCDNFDENQRGLVQNRFVQQCIEKFSSCLPRDAQEIFAEWSGS